MEKCNNVIMKTFKNCGLALAIAAALLMTTASCSSENELTESPNPEQPAQPTTDGVKITVSAGISDDATTRSEVATEDGKRVLKFTTGDRLYVYGEIDATTSVAGYLTMDGAPTNSNKTATFTGTIKAYTISGVTPVETTMPAGNDPLALCTHKTAKATLVHKDLNTDAISITLGKDAELYTSYMYATDVEMLMTKSLPVQGDYVSGTGFTLSSERPIINCTLTGLTPGTTYDIGLFYEDPTAWIQSFRNSFTADANGVISVAFASSASGNKNWRISVEFPSDYYYIDLGTKDMTAKVYNVTRHWTGLCFAKSVSGSVNLASVTDNILVQDGSTLSGTLATGLKVSIADGATVTFSGLDMKAPNNTTSAPYTGIDCLGDATINLVGTNSVKVKNCADGAIFIPAGSTLTIEGTGSLEAISEGYGCAGIGGRYYEIKGIIYGIACGNITINGGNVTAEGGIDAAGIGSGYWGSCGNITIGNGITRVTAIQGCRKNGSADPIGRGVSNLGLGTVTFGTEEVCINGNWNTLHTGYYDDLYLSIDEVNLGDNVSPDPRTVWTLTGPTPPSGDD